MKGTESNFSKVRSTSSDEWEELSPYKKLSYWELHCEYPEEHLLDEVELELELDDEKVKLSAKVAHSKQVNKILKKKESPQMIIERLKRESKENRNKHNSEKKVLEDQIKEIEKNHQLEIKEIKKRTKEVENNHNKDMRDIKKKMKEIERINENLKKELSMRPTISDHEAVKAELILRPTLDHLNTIRDEMITRPTKKEFEEVKSELEDLKRHKFAFDIELKKCDEKRIKLKERLKKEMEDHKMLIVSHSTKIKKITKKNSELEVEMEDMKKKLGVLDDELRKEILSLKGKSKELE
jgi:chromosome segregation ATPase